jgi:phosphatidylserine decarboxylase
MIFENERATMLVEWRGIQLAVVMIASRLVRRIVTYVDQGQDLLLGQRIGMIRFGSQVDLVLPALPDLVVTATPGTRVTAGESVVAILSRLAALSGRAEGGADGGRAAR